MTPDEFEAIKERHAECNFTVTKTEWQERAAFQAHADRATLLSALDRLRAENAALAAGACCVPGGLVGDEGGTQVCALQAKLVKRLEPDMFWDFDDPEQPHDSVEELLDNTDAEGEGIVQVQRAISLPDAGYVYRFVDDPESDDRELTIEQLSDEDYKHYQAALSVARGAREMWREMVDNLAAKLFAEEPGPLHAWMDDRPWSSVPHHHRQYHTSLARDRLASALQEQRPLVTDWKEGERSRMVGNTLVYRSYEDYCD